MGEIITIFDSGEGINSEYAITILWSSENMGRNTLCFCGSGKKTKYCHPDVYEKSLVANLLRIYSQLDKEAEKAHNSPCVRGCTECCTADFSISKLEFYAILHHLGIGDKGVHSWSAKEKLKFADYEDFRTFSTCILLDDTSMDCKIYSVRPIICRKYGKFKETTKSPCSVIAADKTAQTGLLPENSDIDTKNNILNSRKVISRHCREASYRKA